MGLVKDVDGSWASLTGTVAEVTTALDSERIPAHKVKGIYWDSTAGKCVAVYHIG